MKCVPAGIVFLGLLAGCATQPANTRAATAQEAIPAVADSGAKGAGQPLTASFDSITLSRSPCFGKCPVYSVTVHADGRVEYDGDRWVSATGKHRGQTSKEALEKLADALNSRRIPLIVDYRPGKPACGKPVTTDMPGATITIRKGGTTHTLYYYGGCPNVPDWLPALARQIDSAAGSGRWVGGSQAAEILRRPSG